MGSTEWIRKGSMIVRQRSTSGGYPGPTVLAEDAVVHASAGEAMVQEQAQAVGHVPATTADVRSTVDDLGDDRHALVPEGNARAARQRLVRDADRVLLDAAGHQAARPVVAVEARTVPADVRVEQPRVAHAH